MTDDVLPRMSAIVKIVVTSEDEVPARCVDCRFLDQVLYEPPFCVVNRRVDFPTAKPDWCPIMVQGSTEELLFCFRNMREKDKQRVADRKRLRRSNGK